MVSPLFIEIFGGLFLFGLFRIAFLYLLQRKTRESNVHRLDQRLYMKALNDYFKDPNNQQSRDSVYFIGHSFYSHGYPNKKKKNILELVLDDLEESNPQKKRENLIKKDLNGKKMAA
jgi:hypothetical protein